MWLCNKRARQQIVAQQKSRLSLFSSVLEYMYRISACVGSLLSKLNELTFEQKGSSTQLVITGFVIYSVIYWWLAREDVVRIYRKIYLCLNGRFLFSCMLST